MRRHLSALLTSGAVELVAATGISGGAGYLLTLLVGIEIGPAEYVSFGVLWSSLFFTVGTLNGLQQEIARASRPTESGSGNHVVRDVVMAITALVVVAVLSTSALWIRPVFQTDDWWLAIPLALGLAGHTVTTSLVGILHGLHRTRLVAAAVVLDGLLRFALVLVVIQVTHSLELISLALIAPYLLMPAFLWVKARQRLRASTVDVSRRVLTRQAASTLLAAAATGALVSGISLLIAAAGRDVSASHVGAMIFSINITRAPLIIVVGALQNFIVVRLRDRADWRRVLLLVSALVAAVALILTGAAAAVGPTVLGLLLHGETVTAPLVAAIVGSGGLVALMTVTGAAVLARSRHSMYTLGWLLAAFVTAVILFAIPDFDVAITVALLSGPVVGLAVHLGAVLLDGQTSSRGPSGRPSVAT